MQTQAVQDTKQARNVRTCVPVTYTPSACARAIAPMTYRPLANNIFFQNKSELATGHQPNKHAFDRTYGCTTRVVDQLTISELNEFSTRWSVPVV
jgi:hypothetical protein